MGIGRGAGRPEYLPRVGARAGTREIRALRGVCDGRLMSRPQSSETPWRGISADCVRMGLTVRLVPLILFSRFIRPP